MLRSKQNDVNTVENYSQLHSYCLWWLALLESGRMHFVPLESTVTL